MYASSGPALKPRSPWVRQGIYASAAPSSLDQKELENMRDSAPEAASTDDGLNVPSAVQGQCVLKSRGPHGHAPSSKTREEPVSWAERHNTRGPLPPHGRNAGRGRSLNSLRHMTRARPSCKTPIPDCGAHHNSARGQEKAGGRHQPHECAGTARCHASKRE